MADDAFAYVRAVSSYDARARSIVPAGIHYVEQRFGRLDYAQGANTKDV
jgi:hypothetical protein